jgi:hypothetical protein
MSDEIKIDPEAIEQEMLSLRERLGDLEEFKRLAQKLGKLPDTPRPNKVDPVSTTISQKADTPTAPAGRLVTGPTFNGTVASLVDVYRFDSRSPYQNLRFKVRANYDGILNRVVTSIGQQRIADLNKDKVQSIYEGWVDGGKIAMAHAMIGRFRLICQFGMNVLEEAECTRLSTILHTMRFKIPEKRIERLTAAHVDAIRDKAHELDWHSIALAQVIQFELGLRQLDTIGEWTPLSEAGDSDVIWGEEKWLRGLRWEQIDENLVLRHTTTNRLQKPQDIVVDLKSKPAIMEELDWVGKRPTSGPVIICEATGLPYSSAEFRRKWRIVATKAGVPASIRNTDSVRASEKKEESKEQPKDLLSAGGVFH